MENCLNNTEVYYKPIKEYVADIDKVIEFRISKNKGLVFAAVAESAGITVFVIREYPELRNYVLKRMLYYKEIQVINEKIDRAINSLLKSNQRITFTLIAKRCKFGSHIIHENQYIKDRIRSVMITANR